MAMYGAYNYVIHVLVSHVHVYCVTIDYPFKRLPKTTTTNEVCWCTIKLTL